MTVELMDAGEFVEIGTIADTHGLYGELRVRSLTDFPEERFETVCNDTELHLFVNMRTNSSYLRNGVPCIISFIRPCSVPA